RLSDARAAARRYPGARLAAGRPRIQDRDWPLVIRVRGRVATDRRLRASTPAPWRDELLLEAIQDRVEPDLERARGCGSVVGSRARQASAQPRDLRGNLSGAGHRVAHALRSIGALVSDLAGERAGRRWTERVSEYVREDCGSRLVDLRALEA